MENRVIVVERARPVKARASCWNKCCGMCCVLWALAGVMSISTMLMKLESLRHHLLFIPDVPNRHTYDNLIFRSPENMSLPFQNVTFHTKDDVFINAWFIPQEKSNNMTSADDVPTLMYCHGNTGNMGHYLTHIKYFYDTTGFNILAFDYRGFGESEGTPSEDGLILDGKAAISWLHENGHARHGIIVYGQNVGGAVAIALAQETKVPLYGKFGGYAGQVRAVIVESTFSSLYEMARLMALRSMGNESIRGFMPKHADLSDRHLMSMHTMQWLDGYLTKFNNREIIKDVRVPTLIITALKNRVIPASQSRELINASRAKVKMLVEIPKIRHRLYADSGLYTQGLKKFLVRASLKAPPGDDKRDDDDDDDHRRPDRPSDRRYHHRYPSPPPPSNDIVGPDNSIVSHADGDVGNGEGFSSRGDDSDKDSSSDDYPFITRDGVVHYNPNYHHHHHHQSTKDSDDDDDDSPPPPLPQSVRSHFYGNDLKSLVRGSQLTPPGSVVGRDNGVTHFSGGEDNEHSIGDDNRVAYHVNSGELDGQPRAHDAISGEEDDLRDGDHHHGHERAASHRRTKNDHDEDDDDDDDDNDEGKTMSRRVPTDYHPEAFEEDVVRALDKKGGAAFRRNLVSPPP